MVWFKVDDRLPLNPKMAGVSIAAVGLWVEAGAWASASQTDGQVLKRLLRVLHPDASEKLAEELVAAGLWEDQGDHWQIHDFLKYNPPREEVEAKKARRSRAGKLGGIKSGKSRRSKREANAEANAKANAEAKHEAKTNPVPVPVPYISTNVDISPKPPTGVESDEEQIREPSSEPTVEFTQFWSLYPNHDYEDAAVREFRRVRRRRVSLVALLQGAQMLRDEHRDPRYIPAAAKWLHDGGWKNRPRPRAPASSSGPVPSRSQQNQDANAALIARYAQEEAQQPQGARKEIGS
ncbi:hypothetical protein J3U01_09840 [Bifidobacterium sp. B4107]|uniref:hypothetical protein n=2 Tax=Bifidobacterium TaxID=1678 RepID=UPI00226B9072|nr:MULTISPECIES: hypothetical protein [unclassified Bifidobacterium]MCX8648702.1 hypothetical protein [Bifidobacterium sp. B4107]MCX8652892.1 hypothetical protein [Bifidobacterium sp. B4111]